MTPAACSRVRMDLGGYALGALEPDEAAAVRAHLEWCSACRAEDAELALVPATLARLGPVPPETLGDATDPDAAAATDSRLAAILDRLHRERMRQRRHRALAMVAAALLVIAVGGGAWAAAASLGSSQQAGQPSQADQNADRSYGPSPTGEPVRWDAANEAIDVGATVTMRPVTWGTEVDVVMRGVEPGQACEVLLVDSDGDEWSAGSWEVAYDGELTWTGGVGVGLKQVDRVVIASEGTPLLTLRN